MSDRERKKRPTPPEGDRRITVSDYYETCSTRERARRFYPVLLERLENAPDWGKVTLSFEGVDFVSPSFLDDTLLRLAQDRPELAKRLVIIGLSPYTAKRLTSMLDRSRVTVPVTEAQERELERRLSAYREDENPGAPWTEVRERLQDEQ